MDEEEFEDSTPSPEPRQRPSMKKLGGSIASQISESPLALPTIKEDKDERESTFTNFNNISSPQKVKLTAQQTESPIKHSISETESNITNALQ